MSATTGRLLVLSALLVLSVAVPHVTLGTGLGAADTVKANDLTGGETSDFNWDGIEEPTVEVVGGTEPVIDFADLPDGTDDLVAYVIVEGSPQPTLNSTFDAENRTLTLNNHPPGISYDVRIQALDDGDPPNETTDGPTVTVKPAPLSWPDAAELAVADTTPETATLVWGAAEPVYSVARYQVHAYENDTLQSSVSVSNLGETGSFEATAGNLTVEAGEFTLETAETLSPATGYEFRLTAVDRLERSTEPLTTNGTTASIGQPAWNDSVDSSVTETTEDTATLEVDEEPIDYFEELVFYDGDGNQITTSRPLAAGLGGLAANTTYEVTVAARNEVGDETGDGPTVTFTTAAAESPHNLSASVTRTNVTLSWNGRETGEYRIFRNGSQVTSLDAESLNGMQYVDAGLDTETTYEYEIYREVDGDISDSLSATARTGLVSATRRVTVDENGYLGIAAGSEGMEISENGEYLVVEADDSVSTSSSVEQRIHRYNLQTGEREDIAAYGPDDESLPFAKPFSQPTISRDGSVLAYVASGTYADDQIYVYDSAANTTTLVTATEDGTGNVEAVDGGSAHPSLSADGRYVAFQSDSEQLVAENVTGTNAYVYDRQAETFHLVPTGSVSDLRPEISPDGNYVVFQSDNQTLTDRPDQVPDGQLNVFLYDIENETFEWVSEPNGGGVPENPNFDSDSKKPVVSANAEDVVFRSRATNLLSEQGDSYVFYRYNRTTGSIVGVSKDFDARDGADITPDGRYITTGTTRIDTQTGQTTDFGYNLTGEPWNLTPRDISVSDDGTMVSFRGTKAAPNMVELAGDENDAYVTYLGDDSVLDVPSWGAEATLEATDVQAGTLTLGWEALEEALYYYVYVDGELETTTTKDTTEATIDDLDQETAYTVTVEAINERGVRSTEGPTRTQQTAELTPPSSIRTQPYDRGIRFDWSDDLGGGDIDDVEILRDGEDIEYDGPELYLDTGLDPETTYEYELVFEDENYNTVSVSVSETTLADGEGIETTLLDRDQNGDPFADDSEAPDITPDGGLVVFQSQYDGFGLPETASDDQIYLRDTDTGSVELISRPDGTGTDAAGDSDSDRPRISDDGSRVYFLSDSQNLDTTVEPKGSDSDDQLYLRNRDSGTTRLVTQVDGEIVGERAMADEPIEDYDVSRDGDRVVFDTTAANIHPEADGTDQVYLYDRTTDEITLVSRAIDSQPTGADVYDPKISDDGAYVVFISDAPDLVENVTNDLGDVYRYEVTTGEIERLSLTQDGEEIYDDDAQEPVINEDGSVVAFRSRNEALGSSGEDSQVFVWRAETGTTEHVEIETEGYNSEYAVENLALSPGGRFVAFDSYHRVGFGSAAEIILPREPNATAEKHIYVYDTVTDYLMRGDVTTEGEPADANPDDSPFRLVDDTPTLLYTSEGDNLADDVDDADDHTFRTELLRFNQIAEVDPPRWSADANLTAEPLGQTTVELDWNGARHDIGIDSYVVETEGIEDNVTVSGGETKTVVTGLDPERTYTFTVYAEDANGQQSDALTGNATTLGADSVVSLSADGVGGGAELAWEPALEDVDVVSYVVQHRETGGDWVDRQTLDGRETNATTDAPLAAETTYDYRVLAVDSDGQRTAHTAIESMTTSAIEVDVTRFFVPDPPQFGYVAMDGELVFEILGNEHWNATAVVAYTTWYAEDGTLLDAPRNATTRVDLRQTDPGVYRSQNFSLPNGAVSVTEVSMMLADGEGETVVTETDSDPGLNVTGTLAVSVSSIPLDEDARIEAWSEGLQYGAVESFDGNGTYTFETLAGAVDAAEDAEKAYEVRLREGPRALIAEYNVSVKPGLDNPVETDAVDLRYGGPAEIFAEVTDHEGEPLRGSIVDVYDNASGDWITSETMGSSGATSVFSTESTLRYAGVDEILLVVKSPVIGQAEIERAIDVEPGDRTETFQFPEPETTTLSGYVTDESGDPVENITVESTARWRTTRSATTDGEGFYEIEHDVPRERVTLSATRSVSSVDRLHVSARRVTPADIDDGLVNLTARDQRRYEFEIGNFSYYTPGGGQQRFRSLGGSEAEQFEFQVSGENIPTLVASRTNGGYPIELWTAPGEIDGAEVTFSLAPTELGLDRMERTVKLGGDRRISQDFEYSDDQIAGVVGGRLVVDGSDWEGSRDDTADVRIYDENGTRVTGQHTADGEIRRTIGDAGTYELRVTAEHDGREHFAVETFTLDDSLDSVDLGAVALSPGGRFGFQQGNAITASQTELAEGARSSVRVDYENTENDTVTDGTLNLTLPEDVTLIDGSVRLGSDPAAVDDVYVDGSAVTVDLGAIEGGESGTVRFQIEADTVTDPRDSDLTAKIGYDDGEWTEELLGTVEFDLGSLTIDVPESVESRELSLQGRAPSESSLRVYADGNVLEETTVGPNGYWSTSVTLPDSEPPTWYRLHAESTKDGETTSSPGYLVLYDPEEPRLEQVTMWQSGDPNDTDFPNLPTRLMNASTAPITFSTTGGVARFPRTMLAGLPFVFELQFNEPERVSDVEVIVEGPAGGSGEATYNETTGLWEAKLDNDQRRGITWRAGKIYVNYETDTERPPELTRQLSRGENARELIDDPIDPDNESWAFEEDILIDDFQTDDGAGTDSSDVETLSTAGDVDSLSASADWETLLYRQHSDTGLGSLMASSDSDAPGPAFELEEDVYIASGDITGKREMELSMGHDPVVSSTGTTYQGTGITSSGSLSDVSDANTKDSPFSYAAVNVRQPSEDRLVVTVSGEIPLQEFLDEDPAPDTAPDWHDAATVEVVEMADDNESATLQWTSAQDSLWVDEYRVYRANEVDPVATVYGDTQEATVDLEAGTNEFTVEAVNPQGVESTDGPTVEVTKGDPTAELSTSEITDFQQLSADLAEPEWQQTLRLTSLSGGSSVLSTNRLLLKGNGLVGALSTANDALNLGGELEDINNFEANWPEGACGPPPQELQDDIEDAKAAAIGNVAISASYGVAATAAGTGVGAIGGATLAVAALGVDLATASYKEQAMADLEDSYDEAVEEATEDGEGGGGGQGECEEDDFPESPQENDDDDDEEDPEDSPGDNPIADPQWKIDPSGFVYEVEANNTVENVTATILRYDEEKGRWETWNAESWGEVNPQQTDAGGNYGWDVPPGDWRVVYEKEGYRTTYSQDFYEDPIEVPPPHFEVNAPMESLAAPTLANVSVEENATRIDVEFDRHVKQTTVSPNTVQVRDETGTLIHGNLSFADTAAYPDGDSNETVALTVQFDASEQLDVGNYTVSISPLVQSYADVPLADGMQETVEVEPPSEEPGEDGSDDGVPNDEGDTTDSSDDSDSSDESSSVGDDPPSDEETVPDVEIPAGVEALQTESVPVAYNVSTGTSQVEFGSETPVERIDFATGGVVGEVSVAALSGEPESTGDPPGATVSVTQITVPDGDEDEPATVWMRVNTESITEVGGSSGDLRVARYADGEWQELETTLVGETADAVILEADTPGFSLFAVSAVSEPDAVISLQDSTVETGAPIELSATDSTDRYGEIVAYEWSIADQELTGETATLEVNEPGEYTVRLIIRNDAGETSTATATLSVQTGDEPGATDESGEETTATDESDDEPAQSSSPLLTFGPAFALLVLLAAGLIVWRRRGDEM